MLSRLPSLKLSLPAVVACKPASVNASTSTRVKRDKLRKISQLTKVTNTTGNQVNNIRIIKLLGKSRKLNLHHFHIP